MVDILKATQAYVNKLLTEVLPKSITYHHLGHTTTVVNSVTEIGQASTITDDQLLVLQTSAWLHDTGYCYTYTGHEEASKSIASAFLKTFGCSPGFIEQVTSCIEATKMPQKPSGLLQQAICDADMAHLSRDSYLLAAKDLRREWEVHLNKHYTDKEWNELNLNLMLGHNYFTPYARQRWQLKKEKNITLIINELSRTI